MKLKIKKVYAREILDSRGNPTVEVETELENGIRRNFGCTIRSIDR